MTSRPSAYPDWATSVVNDPTSGVDNRVAAPSAWQQYGWTRGEQPPRQYDNWFKWLVGQWVRYIEERVTGGRVITVVERIAAVMLGLVTLLVFVSALGRYLFASPIPDAFDLSRLALAVAIMWGFASLGFRGNHIKVDILAEMLGAKARRILDLFAWLGLLLFTILLTWKLGGRVLSQMPGGETTMDLRLPHWPFLAFVVAGLVMAVLTTLIRLWLVLRYGEGLEPHETLKEDEAHGAGHE